MTGIRGKALAFLSLNILGVSIWPIVLKVGGESFNALAFLFFGFLCASLVSFLLLLYLKDFEKFRVMLQNRKDTAILVIGGLLTYALPAILITVSTVYTSASLASVIFRSWVFFAIIFTPLILKVKVTKYQVLSVSIGFIALYYALTGGYLFRIGNANAIYTAALIFSAVSAALGTLLIKSRSAAPMAQMLLFDISATAFFGLLLISAFILHYRIFINFDLTTGILILFIGTISYSIGSFFYLYALRVFDPIFVGNISLLAPILTFFFAAALIHEVIYPYYLISFAIIVIGIFINQSSVFNANKRVENKKWYKLPPIYDITNVFVDNKEPAIYASLSGGNRVIATCGEIAKRYKLLPQEKKKTMERIHQCILFTIDNPYPGVSVEELNLIRSLLKNEEKEIFIGIGNPEKIENLINEMRSETKEL